MDQQRLTTWTRSMRNLPSRRDIVRGLAGAVLGLGSLGLAGPLAAKNKNQKSKKGKKRKQNTPPVFNQYGCLDVGQPCKGNSAHCCSGVCAGKKPKKGKPDRRVCAAHNASVCNAQLDSCTVGAKIFCGPNGSICTLTTGNAGF